MTTETTPQDKTQIGLSRQAADDLEYIKDHLRLPRGLDAYRLAVAAAIARKLEPTDESVSRTTAYNATGTLDLDGAIRAAVIAIRSDHHGRPYALVERLAEAGLTEIREHLENGLPIRDYLVTMKPSPPSAEEGQMPSS